MGLILFIQGFGIESIKRQNAGIAGLRLATFDVDATPPAGSYMTYNPVINIWYLGKVPERVEVHTIHQHDAPISDFSAEKILKKAGTNPMSYESTFEREVISRLGKAVRESLKQAQPLTCIGYGEAEVYKVASARRILGADGLVRATRYTTCTDSALRTESEGVIDPMVSVISFWNNENPITVLSYYATHPQSYYRTGIPNPDFPGIARFYRQLAVPKALHVHFNGAGGNITAGKYNDGSKDNRGILAAQSLEGVSGR